MAPQIADRSTAATRKTAEFVDQAASRTKEEKTADLQSAVEREVRGDDATTRHD